MTEEHTAESDARCLSSAELPTAYRTLKRCQLASGHDGDHYWRETPEGHDRAPLTVAWDDQRRTRVIPPE